MHTLHIKSLLFEFSKNRILPFFDTSFSKKDKMLPYKGPKIPR